MGTQFDKLVHQDENTAISICKQIYLDYLHRMLSTMKTIYLELKGTESEDLAQYVSLAQYVVGNIIQYCPSFVKEIDRTFKDLPILDYFTNPETFPQPGSNEIAYAAQRLRGIARKDTRNPFLNATQSDIFWSIKSFLERSVRNHQEGDFVEFCVLAMCEAGDETIAPHVGLLRSFVVQEIFCEYLRMAAEAPEMSNPVWSYVLLCLRAVREVYSCLWDAIVAENISGLKGLVDELISLMLAVCGLMDIIYEVCNVDGAVYTAFCSRCLDFALLVDHVAFHLTGIPAVSGMFLT